MCREMNDEGFAGIQNHKRRAFRSHRNVFVLSILSILCKPVSSAMHPKVSPTQLNIHLRYLGLHSTGGTASITSKRTVARYPISSFD